MRQRHNQKKGFNLIEAAIVLAVVGLVIGGIWVAAASIHHKMQVNSAEKLILMVAQGVYNKYPANLYTSGWVGLTEYLINTKIIPSDTPVIYDPLHGWQILDPWGKDMMIGLNDMGDGPYLAVGFNDVDFKTCQSLMLGVTSHFRDGDNRLLVGAGTTSVGMITPFVRNANGIYCDDSAGQQLYFLFQLR